MDVALRAEDLAPGARAVAQRDWSGLRVRRVRDALDPDFALGYGRLWAEFGSDGAMEARAVIEARLAWDPRVPVAGARFAYEMLVLEVGGALAAVRDQTAIVRLAADGSPSAGPVVVHLSHAWVAPAQRGSGLAAWLRALPLAAARRCAAAAGLVADAPVVLVAEMEPLRGGRGPQRSYARAGFLRVDPALAPYAQPDFRSPELPALPFQLVLRRVGRETEREIPAAELAAIVESLYAVYGAHFSERAVGPLRRAAAEWTRERARFPLQSPVEP